MASPPVSGKALLVTAYAAGASAGTGASVTDNNKSIPYLLQEYNKCSTELQNLRETNAVENAQNAVKSLKQLQKKEQECVRQLQLMRAKESKDRHRVERQEKKPSIFGHGGGILFENKDKTARLKAELDKLDEKIAKMNKALDDIQEKIKKSGVDASEARNLLQREKQLNAMMESLIDEVVRLTPDYAQLSSIRANSLEIESLRKQMGVIYLTCETAMKDYQQSLQLTRKARNSNLFSAVNNRNERIWQLRRDRMMTASTRPAEAASAKLVETFKNIPQQVRIRYPALMEGVGNVPFASLSVGKFGKTVLVGAAFGNVGDAMNKISQMRKIKENEQQIQKCMQIVKGQMVLISAVNNQMDQEIQHLVNKITIVRKSVFERERNGGNTGVDLLTFGVSQTTPSYATVNAPAAPSAAIATVNAAASSRSRVASAVPAAAAVIETLPGKLILTMDHKVDELSPVMLQHNIISISEGEVVDLVGGSLESGLGGAYCDYIEVCDKYGKTGKISRKVVKPASVKNATFPAVPPPAIF